MLGVKLSYKRTGGLKVRQFGMGLPHVHAHVYLYHMSKISGHVHCTYMYTCRLYYTVQYVLICGSLSADNRIAQNAITKKINRE
jgi:hypothetical protein